MRPGLQSRPLTDQPRDFDSGSDQMPPGGISPTDDPAHVDADLCDEMGVAEIDAATEAVEEGVIRSGKLAGKTMWAAIWILAAPVLLQQTMQACVGMFDKIIAGSLPEQMVVPAMDGLGIGSYIGWFVGIAMAGLGIGGQAIIARAMGRGDTREGHHALGQAVAISLVWGTVVGVTLWLIASPLAAICQLSPEATEHCITYIQVLSLSMPACALMIAGGMCLHGAGETTWPSIIAISINFVNITMSFLLSGVDLKLQGRVIENPLDLDWHVAGIAAGSSIAYVVGGLATLAVMIRGVKDLRLEKRDLPFNPLMIKRIVRIGVPNFCEGISMWAVNLFVLMVIGVIAVTGTGGEGLVGAHVIAVQWEAFSFMPGFAIGTAAGALAGQYLGASNPRMAQKAVVACTGIGVVVMTALGVLFFFQGEWLTSLVSTQEVHLENTPKLLAICGVMQLFFAITMVVRQGLRGVGDTKWTFIITTFSSYAVRLPAAYLLGVTFDMGLPGVWIALSGEFAVRAALFSARFIHGGWKNLEV